ncbi:MAG: hypothetical protein JXR48_09545 [Candidatus Delongbacteria bacterium]|nr:hypothetical protein [Candidatus Delongbacteria bacterium]MBN2835196.1 hypothetical protein [Candidatus Delongbacteria bacterium]
MKYFLVIALTTSVLLANDFLNKYVNIGHSCIMKDNLVYLDDGYDYDALHYEYHIDVTNSLNKAIIGYTVFTKKPQIGIFQSFNLTVHNDNLAASAGLNHSKLKIESIVSAVYLVKTTSLNNKFQLTKNNVYQID